MNYPSKKGLYNPIHEKDNCGVGFVAKIDNIKSHSIVKKGLQILNNLSHRGAAGADPNAGDGAGIMLQLPDEFFIKEAEKLNFNLPPVGQYAVAMVFLNKDSQKQQRFKDKIDKIIKKEGLQIIQYRPVPVDNNCLSVSVLKTEPAIFQIFIKCEDGMSQNTFERKLFVTRKLIDNKINHPDDVYICSMSSRTIIYKGMFLAHQVKEYYKDLSCEDFKSAMALVHQRFSTNTFPAWFLAHPYRFVAHNGEINTIRGNINWMAARKHIIKSDVLKNDLNKLWPIIANNQSDSAGFDNALELLYFGGYSISDAIMLLIPEAWQKDKLMNKDKKAFYEYNAALMEPWDGPAAVAFSDGTKIGATLDRNGLRPARYLQTNDGLVVMASEMGVLNIPEENIIKKWRLQPGKMLLIDLEKHQIISDDDIKKEASLSHPYQQWLSEGQVKLSSLKPESEQNTTIYDKQELLQKQIAFGYSKEDLKFLMQPMVEDGAEAIGSMGADNPLAVLSDKPKTLYNYFKQKFAQVTNPPIDPIRENIVMSLISFVGPLPNILDPHPDKTHQRLELEQPILNKIQFSCIKNLNNDKNSSFKIKTIDCYFAKAMGENGLSVAVDSICAKAEDAVQDGFNIIILSDRNMNEDKIAIPSLLSCSAVHQHLIKTGHRTKTGLIIETGEAREIHHFATLSGFGAQAIFPYLALSTTIDIAHTYNLKISDDEAQQNYIKAIGKGLYKVMSKMGICTYQSYCGAQIFDAVGLSSQFIDEYFTNTDTKIGGIGIDELAIEIVQKHNLAFAKTHKTLHNGGDYAYRFDGEIHAWSPQIITALQDSVRNSDFESFKKYRDLANNQDQKLKTLRGLFEIKSDKKPIDINEVEPASDIVRRFATGAMSFGSISYEAHTNLAIAMNRLKARSNTGEGGELSERFSPMPNGDSMRSAIKQVASGRFGVTTEYLVNSDMIQIKMAQGAKPGEGGQLPGHKVDETVARIRHSTAGVGLISPPPHHDIYSIEDLAQLIYDLKNVQPKSDISVKLVSEVGVGTVAAGVAKAHADHITISGYDGGTGASPLTSIKHAGSAWEIGLAETQQTLVLNNLRGRIKLQVDGGIRTGRDIIIGALLGADEFAFATAALIAEGCIMMRKCHLNNCPVGIATQKKELRAKFTGKPEHIVRFFTYLAEDARALMAKLGYKKLDDLIGQAQLLQQKRAENHFKTYGLNFKNLFYKENVDESKTAIYHQSLQNHKLEEAIDNILIKKAENAINTQQKVDIDVELHNYNRSFGAMLSGTIASKYGHKGLPDNTINIRAYGTCGQSMGAFLSKGISLTLAGAGNDYVGKGLCGGKIIIHPAAKSKLISYENIIVGNTVLYGAISGNCFISGIAGERFAVRNSGAIAVVEGIGNHGCEYMTGGVVVVLGETGINFGAGMSGGIAYVYDKKGDFVNKLNTEMVGLESLDDDIPKNKDDLKNHLKYDEFRLKILIQQHYINTHSPKAKIILNNWQEERRKFKKIMPIDYKKALLRSKK
ncbi:MAG: glutamate synthase large subunit [Gammaproteobacteria bacterium]|nr:MAG: glutamate synthase large subunit [Gammaproteobacteria bacterium]